MASRASGKLIYYWAQPLRPTGLLAAGPPPRGVSVNATVAATAADSNGFSDLGLHEGLVHALRDVGYEAPTPIRAATIPPLLSGSDVLGQAQTGTGKTGAFALPILAKIDVSKPHTQAMVLVPTRELAIQVAEAFQRYATHMKGFHVLPIYG